MNELTRAELLRQASAETWAILPSALEALLLLQSMQPRQANEHPLLDLEAAAKPLPDGGRIARIPIIGAISRRDSIWSFYFGGTSVERLTKALREVTQDDTVSTVLLDIDSPGGTVSGLPELAAEVRRVRESKRVVALANSLTASAAYWIASQADEIIATPEALVGSVGVFVLHEDWSKMNERIGVKPTYIASGPYKTEGNPDEPLSDAARDHLQSIVDSSYALFVDDVAKGRGVTPAAVRADYGKGRVLMANVAKAAGMIDRVSGAGETLRRLMGVKGEADSDPELVAVEETTVVNSQARLALMRRRLEIQKQL